MGGKHIKKIKEWEKVTKRYRAYAAISTTSSHPLFMQRIFSTAVTMKHKKEESFSNI